MGILVNEEPLKWEEIVPHLDIIKDFKHGIAQFISIYEKVKSRKDGIFRWGDETEYTIVKFDHESKKVRVCLRSDEILKQLEAEAQINEEIGKQNEVLWAPEVGGYMIEGTPGQPYGALLASFNNVETNLIKRRQTVQKLLKEDEAILSMSFPALGTADFSFPTTFVDPKNSFGKSIFYPDEVLYQGNPRYLTLFKSILGRRGEKAEINIPIFKDEKTANPFIVSF
uniref:Glutamate--cysteine ligase n=1 Tax=Panagrolaimus davidi TaxID=227884 RepID=A0A914PLK5_9BILA